MACSRRDLFTRSASSPACRCRSPILEPGRLSAGLAARRLKHNQELEAGAPDLERLNRLVMGALVRHPTYRAGALPLHAASPLYARYRPGMTYGDHLDDPNMGTGGVMYRSDVAVTVFLNAPEAYDGGELVIRTAAGDAVLYPAGSIHNVNPVTRGERLVALTWVQSLVRDAARRELLYGLNAAREKLLQSAPGGAGNRAGERRLPEPDPHVVRHLRGTQ